MTTVPRDVFVPCIWAFQSPLHSAGAEEATPRHLRFAIARFRHRRATALRRDPPVSFAQNFQHPGNLRDPHQRPAPPNFVRQRHRRVGSSELASVAHQQTHLQHQFFPRQSQQRSDSRVLQRRQRHPPAFQMRRQPARKSRAEPALRVEEQPPSRVPSFSVGVFTDQRNHLSHSSSLLPCFLASLLPSSSLLRALDILCAKSLAHFPKLLTLNCQLLTAFFPSSVITFPRSFTTPLSAPVGIRIISSNNPVIAVKNSSMLSSRSRV